MNLTDKQKEDLNDHIKTLEKDYRYNIDHFDKQSIYIASGALAISLTFIKDILPIENIYYLGFYYASILSFSISIILGFLSFLISSELIFKRLRLLKAEKFKETKRDIITRILIFANAALISFGILLLASFTIININHSKKITIKKQTTMERNDNESLDFDPNNLIKSLRVEDLPESLHSLTNTESVPEDSSDSSNEHNDSEQDND
jgi:hypothetical protein